MMTRALRIAFLALSTLPLAAASVHGQVTTRNFELKAHFNDYPPVMGSPFGAGYAACWAYVHEDGREYAVIGVTAGVAIYNVTDPDNAYFVAFIAGPNSAWHEMKAYRNWIYVVSEGTGPAAGVQIIRMTDPENPVLATTYSATITRAHTVSVDTTRALLYVNGLSGGSWGGLRILSLANPEAPVELGSWGAGSGDTYVHDSAPSGNRLYASSIYSGIQRIIDVTNPATPFELSSWTYEGWTGPEGAFTHNAWPDTSENYLYVTDEVQGEPLKIFDISNPLAPVMVNAITSNPNAIVHNAHVLGDDLHLSNYTEGIRILDITDARHPAEWAWADSYPGASGGFFGAWEVCPYFPSGTIIASDMQTGLYVYRAVRDYGILHVEVVDAATDLPMEGIMVTLASLGDSLRTPADGVVRFAPNPGMHTVSAKMFGYQTAQASRTVSLAICDTVRLEMVAKPTVELTGSVKDANSLVGLEEANLALAYTPVHEHTDALGLFHFDEVPSDLYRIELTRPGYVPAAALQRFGSDLPTTLEYHLQPAATWDDLEAGSGWTVGAAGDAATSGIWTRVDPLGTGAVASPPPSLRGPTVASREGERLVGGFDLLHDSPEEPHAPGEVQPEFDSTPPPGTMCFVTGQGTDPASPGQNDVDGGRTSLTTPALNLSLMADPVIGYWRWFYASGDENDWLAILVSNDDGATWVPVDTLRGLHNHWEQQTFRVADFVAPTSQVKVRFVAADEGGGSLVEAAIDDLVTFEADAAGVVVDVGEAPALGALRFAAPRPNPARGTVHLALHLARAGVVDVEVLDLMGRRVATLYRAAARAGLLTLHWDGRGEDGVALRDGVYNVRARANGESAVTRFVWMR